MTHVTVLKADWTEISYQNSDADVFGNDALTVTPGDGLAADYIALYPAGTWRRATVTGDDGWTVYAFTSRLETDRILNRSVIQNNEETNR